jgi:glycosyltransferase involved in cell wall biosynthesis
MKIAHVVDSFDVGGAEMLVAQICRLQREHGHDPSMYAISRFGQLGEQMLREGFIAQPNLGLNLSHGIRTLWRTFKEAQPDVVHFHNATPTIYGAMAARVAGVPSIVSTRHSLVAPPHKVVPESKYAIAALSCDWIVGICDATTENLRNLRTIPKRKIVRIYNGSAPLKRTAREDWPPKNGFTLLFVGRLEPVKNLRLLLNAFRQALSSIPELRLWMVGDGTERNGLENLANELGISEQVRFWGQQLDVAPFFSSADTFIMSSRSEGLPISLLQAFSSGLPVIVTDVGGMAEAVRLADAGLIVPLGEPEKMAAAIVEMAKSNSIREGFAANALEAFRTRFTLQLTADGYMDLYRNTPRARRIANSRTA